MKTELPVSLIIPSYNRSSKLRRLLDSLVTADFQNEIIIVDDNSTENTGDIIREYSQILPIVFLKNDQNRGPAYSRNRGLSVASNPYVAFTDNDCIVTTDWLIRLYEYMRDSPTHIAGIGGRTLAFGQDIVSRYYQYHKILDPWFYNGRCLYLVSANAIFRKDLVERVGGFDTEINYAGGEDVGLSFKLIDHGYDLLYNPDAIVFHDFQSSLGDLYRTFFRYGSGCRIQYEKYYRNNEEIAGLNYAGLPLDKIEK